jgi:2,4-dienoyl-CoA reductase-like NADH-dependent reductase (Old Yellow Enzyme family)
MVPWRASEDGAMTPAVLDWYERFAAGRPGVLVVEATGIRDVPSGPLLRAGHDRFIDGLAELVARVRRASGGETLLFLQLIDFLEIRRRPEPATYFARYLQILPRHRAALTALDGADWSANSDAQVRQRLAELGSAVLDDREREALEQGLRRRITDVEVPEVQDLPSRLPELFAAAALRACRAGFDGIELHYAHAYTMASFLSALNDRTDGYGGSRAGRVRLPVEVLRHTRQRVKDAGFGDRVVGLRMLADESIAGGSNADDAAYFAVELARAGADFISLSRGGKFEDAQQPKIGEAAYPYTGPSGYECMPTVYSDRHGPFGRNVETVAQVKRALVEVGLATPVVVAGGIATFDQAEQILAAGQADAVAAARQSLADPDWFEKVRLGLGEDVRRCQYTNYCEGLDQRHKQVTCKLWDRVELDEPGVALDLTGRRRLIAPRWRREAE